MDAKNIRAWTGYRPFTLSIRNPADVCDFLQGLLTIIVIIDLEELEKIAKELGHDALLINSDFSLLCKPLGNTQSVYEVKISHHWLGRVAFEFCSLKWLIREALQSKFPLPAGMPAR
jgi:hypothetical protein